MGIFGSLDKNKHKAQQNGRYLLDEEKAGEIDLWSKAYVAEPQCYEKEGREKLLNFVITEGVNTILPVYPDELHKNREENFSDIRLTFVNATKKGKMVDLSFFCYIPVLSDYAVEYREPNVLIRGPNTAEMGLFISGVKQSLERI